MPLTLEQYCTKHNLELIEIYTTFGEERPYQRARVKTTNGKIQYLYFDRSYRRRTLEQQKKDYLEYQKTGMFPSRSQYQRGWRNTTLDNQRRRAKHANNNGN